MAGVTGYVERAESTLLFARARARMPGGVNSPVRAFRAVGGEPVFFASGKGARVRDEDGREYLDYMLSWGPLILGHAHPAVVKAITAQARRGTTFGAPCRLEVDMAETVARLVPSAEMIRMVSSGTEATLSAARLARGITGRSAIVKFAGCYHGHGDSFLIKAGSGVATLGLPDSPGVTESTARDTLVAEFNDLASVEACFAAVEGKVAAVFVEPVVGNMGVVAPRPDFLPGLRALCTRHRSLLVFDEVMTGFRLGLGGAQEMFGVRPDLTTFGKIVGGGLPVGAYAGPREHLSRVAPAGPIYQAGTLSGNPLAMAAGLATLRALEEAPGIYGRLERLGAALEKGIGEEVRRKGYPCRVARVGSMWTLFFTQDEVTDWPSAARSDTTRFGRFFHAMLARGIYLAPAQFEANFLSAAHTKADVEETVAACAQSLESVFA
jgi:glutamate-1-semialdehyde 2,1-aminomutase